MSEDQKRQKGIETLPMLIALVSLIVSIIAYNSTRKTEVHAIQGYYSFDPSEDRNGLWLENAGAVSAWVKFVNSPRFTSENVNYQNLIRSLNRENYPESQFYFVHDFRSQVLSAGQKIPIFTYATKSSDESKAKFENLLSKMILYSCSCDLAFERCTRTLVRSRPKYDELNIFKKCNGKALRED